MHVEEMTLHNAESSEGFNIALKKARGKKKEEREKGVITTQDIHIWSARPSTYPADCWTDEKWYCRCGIVTPR